MSRSLLSPHLRVFLAFVSSIVFVVFGDIATASNHDANLTISVAPESTSVPTGIPVELELEITNAGPSAVNDATVTHTLEPGMSLADVDARCTVTRSGLVSCSLGTLPGGGVTTLSIALRPNASDTYEPAFSVASSVTPDPDPSSNSASTIITATPRTSANLAVSAVAESFTNESGQFLRYTVTATNDGPDGAENVVVGVVSDPGLTFVEVDPRCVLSGPYAVCSEDAISAANAEVFEIIFQPNFADDEIVIHAMVSTISIDDVASDNHVQTVFIWGNPAAVATDLSISKGSLPTDVGVGQSMRYDLTVTNNGPAAASASVFDALPGNVSLIGASAGCSGFADDRFIRCEFGSLSSKESATAEITVRADASGIAANSAMVLGRDPNSFSALTDTAQTDNYAETVGTISPTPLPADLRLVLSDRPPRPRVAQEFQYIVRVQNRGPTAATDVEIDLELDPTLTFMGAPDGCTFHFPQGTPTVTCDIGYLALHDWAQSAITLRGNEEGSATVSSAVYASSSDPNPSDNSAEESTLIR